MINQFNLYGHIMKLSYFLAFLSLTSTTIESVFKNHRFKAILIENVKIVEEPNLFTLDTFVDYFNVENNSTYCLWFGLDNNTIRYFCHTHCNEISFRYYIENNVSPKLYSIGPQHCPMGGKISSLQLMRSRTKNDGQYESDDLKLILILVLNTSQPTVS